MHNLLIPVGGRSSRFNSKRPKWLLTHPSGELMVTEAVRGLDLSRFDRVVLVCLKDHEKEYRFSEPLIRSFRRIYDVVLEIVFLDGFTKSQAETCYQGIRKAGLNGSVLIKDSDNFFEIDTSNLERNFIAYKNVDIDKDRDLNAKSYVKISNSVISEIKEKQRISDTFVVGAYNFASASEYIQIFKKLEKSFNGELYISYLVRELITSDNKPIAIKSYLYEDWGTQHAWDIYCKGFKTLFLDIDGTLIENRSIHFEPGLGTGEGLKGNLKVIQDEYSTGKVRVILTTARPEWAREQTISELKRNAVPYDVLLMGLPHSRRYLINDYSASNTEPTAIAINVERNGSDLKEVKW